MIQELDPKTWCSYIWYPQGAGGMWINYILWCNKFQTTLPENFKSFEFNDIHQKYPNYVASLIFRPHTTEDVSDSKIRISGDNWFNFYLNVVEKKKLGSYYGNAESVLKVSNMQVTPNLIWRDIIKDPKKFLADLGSLMSVNIPYNKITQQAIKQYIDSCPFPKLDNKFCNTDLYKEWAKAVSDVKNIQTDKEIFEFTMDNYTLFDNQQTL